jgi:hypothetical protein
MQPDGGPEGQIKGLLSRHDTKRKQSLKQLAKEKAPRLKKGKTLTLGSKLAVAEGGGVDGDEAVDE